VLAGIAVFAGDWRTVATRIDQQGADSPLTRFDNWRSSRFCLISLITLILFLSYPAAGETTERREPAAGVDEIEFRERQDFGFDLVFRGEAFGQLPAERVWIRQSFENEDGRVVVLLEEHAGGNVCLSFSNRIVSWDVEGNVLVTERFGNCRGPEIEQTDDEIVLRYDAYEAEHTGHLFPAEVWVFRDGRISEGAVSAPREDPEKGLVGGGCTYKKVSGTAVIDEVNTAPDWQNNCVDPVEVVFHFIPDDPAARSSYLHPDWPDSDRRYVVGDGKNPPRNWARRTGLVIGSQHRAIRSEITQGSCTPVVFLFPDIDAATSHQDCFAKSQ